MKQKKNVSQKKKNFILCITNQTGWLAEFRFQTGTESDNNMMVSPGLVSPTDWAKLEEQVRLVVICMESDEVNLKLLGQVRQKTTVAILIVSRNPSFYGEEICLNAGADDYQPWDKPALLLWKRMMRQVLRHDSILQYVERGSLIQCPFEQDYLLNQKMLQLTPKEYLVMQSLVRFRGNPVSKNWMLQQIWGLESQKNSRVLDTVIKQLRKKISGSELEIQTHYGIGYSIIDHSFQQYEGMEERHEC